MSAAAAKSRKRFCIFLSAAAMSCFLKTPLTQKAGVPLWSLTSMRADMAVAPMHVSLISSAGSEFLFFFSSTVKGSTLKLKLMLREIFKMRLGATARVTMR